MNFDGFIPHEISRFSSLVEQDDPTNLPAGISLEARNVTFRLSGVDTRDGIQNEYGFLLPDEGAVTGLDSLKQSGNPDVFVPIAFSGLGNLYIESPAGSGKVVPITSTQFTPPDAASMQVAAAYLRGYLAFTDLKNSLSYPAVYSLLTGKLDPLSMKSVGVLWQPNTQYNLGEVVTPLSPVGGNGHQYVCTQAGLSGADQPAFPTVEGDLVVDNQVNWTENTPVMAQAIPEPPIPTVNRSAGAGTFAANRDVYILVTLVNGNGETDGETALAFVYVNTTLNDRFIVTSPTLTLWIQALPAPYAVTGYNVYEADVPTGNPAPAIGAYTKVNVAAVAIGTPTNVDTTGLGAAPPTVNGAVIVPLGNICSGLRYMVTMFINRNGYISGMTQPSVVQYSASTDGYELYVAHLAIGPSNTIARLCAFTPAGTLDALADNGVSSAGLYFWISPDFPSGIFDLSKIAPGVTVADVVNGVQMTSTIVNDNTSTTAFFNFTDDYLKDQENDISGNFRKILVPPCSDVWYSQTLKRMFYADDAFPSGWRVSLQDDPESVYDDSSGIIQVAENNSERRIAIREFLGQVYLMKERSGHLLNASAADPTDWSVAKQWGGDKDGAGPCGPRAVDVCTNFMLFVHRSGVWVFEGGQPYKISKEIPETWKRINWAAQQTIWVKIDDETREVRIGVPTGQSTVPDKIIKLNYEELPAFVPPSFAPPIHFSAFVGRTIATGECYKWSVDDIAANVCVRVERPLPAPPDGWPLDFDLRATQSQILFGSSNADGAVAAIIPGVGDDNGVGIDFVYETSCPPEDPKTGGNLMRPNRLGGVQANVDGTGQGSVYVLALRAKDPKSGEPQKAGQAKATKGAEIKLKKPLIAGVPYSCGGQMTNERMRLRFTNDKRPGVILKIKWACIYAAPVTGARPR